MRHPGSAVEESFRPDDSFRLAAALLRFYPFRFFDGLLPCVAALSASAAWASSQTARGLDLRFPLVGVGLLLIVFLTAAYAKRPWAPGGYRSWTYAEWKQACQWLKENTPPETVVYTPRESFGFKWHAERAEYICFKDCPQDAAGILEWNRRLKVVHSWSERSWKDGRYDKEDLVEFRRLTGADYILTRKLKNFAVLPDQQFGRWRLYRLP